MDFIIKQLKNKGLKITPQRIAVYQTLLEIKNHPTAEQIAQIIKEKHPSISLATVYKILDLLVQNQLVKKVKNEKDIMRYDALVHKHHHLYCNQTDRIEDFEDPDLDQWIAAYFQKKQIDHFQIEEINIQITGKFQK